VLLAFPRGRSSAALENGGRLRSRELSRGWVLSISDERRRRWRVQASLGLLKRPFTPCRVSVAGAARVTGRRYDRRTRVLRLTVRARRGRVTVRPCGV
jgi:hypothetical protein